MVVQWKKFHEAGKESPFEAGDVYNSYVLILLGLETLSLRPRRKSYSEGRDMQYFAIVDSAGQYIGPKVNGKPLYFSTALVAKAFIKAINLKESHSIVRADKVAQAITHAPV